MSCRIALRIAETSGASLHIGGDDSMSLKFGGDVYGSEAEQYKGDYLITPSEERQTLPTSAEIMRQDVIIEPIPSNYGRITYNGSTITVW